LLESLLDLKKQRLLDELNKLTDANEEATGNLASNETNEKLKKDSESEDENKFSMEEIVGWLS
jgi:hypothetical protein